MCSGGHHQRGSVRPRRRGLLYLTLAPGSCWGAVWTQSLVQHCGGPSGPGSRVGGWVTRFPVCHAAGKKNEGSTKFHDGKPNVRLK